KSIERSHDIFVGPLLISISRFSAQVAEVKKIRYGLLPKGQFPKFFFPKKIQPIVLYASESTGVSVFIHFFSQILVHILIHQGIARPKIGGKRLSPAPLLG